MTVLSPSAAAIITRHLRVIFTSVSVKSRSGWLLCIRINNGFNAASRFLLGASRRSSQLSYRTYPPSLDRGGCTPKLRAETQIFLTKLDKLEHQITIARLADYSYPDGLTALELLSSRTKRMRQQVTDADNYSAATRTAILREANFLIVRVTYIVGMITRSTSVRNAFELYVPFLDLCKALVGSDARLLISSEWQYVPFTHPQSRRASQFYHYRSAGSGIGQRAGISDGWSRTRAFGLG